MCGIVGYFGPSSPKDIIIEGLKKLEYRGYDSSGIAIFNQGQLKRIRAEGKLKNLEDRISSEKFDGQIGIGHTRWATHGGPSERNAHPHQVNGVSLVHNGIIENYLEIKDELLRSGAQISSDTDSELVAHLISREIERVKDLPTAVKNIFHKLKGAFSILVLWEGQPNTLVAFKDGPPLIVGLGEKQYFVVSDIQAVLSRTQKFIYLNDQEMAVIRDGDLAISDMKGHSLQKKVIEIHWGPDQTEKMGYSHFMLKEIFEQPRAIAMALEPHVEKRSQSVRLNRVGFGGDLQSRDSLNLNEDWENTLKVFSQIKKVMIVGCGTSYFAGLVGKYYFEKLARINTEVDVASEFRYRQPILDSETLVLTISQSGETADTLAAIRLAKAAGAKTLSICNVRNSTIDREALGHMYMNCGPEIGVASTKAFTSTLIVLGVVALALGKSQKRVDQKTETGCLQAFLAVPSLLETVLVHDKYFSLAAETLKKYRGFLFLGRGVSYPIALEGALKLKELAYMHAEGYAAGEMKHGPLALIDSHMAIVVVAPQDELFEKTVSNLEEAKARGGVIISIGSDDKHQLRKLSESFLNIPVAHWMTNPILSVVPLQLMAFHVAQSLGHDVDQPRNLAKSVTVE